VYTCRAKGERGRWTSIIIKNNKKDKNASVAVAVGIGGTPRQREDLRRRGSQM